VEGTDVGEKTAMVPNLSRASNVWSRLDCLLLELQIKLLLLLHASFVFLFLDPDSETLPITN
jgi:hypothetical protein